MSRIASIQRHIGETAELLRQYQTAVVADPSAADALQYDIRSLHKLLSQYQTEFAREARLLHRDECRYRLFRDGENPGLAPVASILSDFQSLVSLIYHSLERQEPLQRATLDASTLAATTFQIGYTFAGSVGFVLTLPNEHLILSEAATRVDDAIETVFALPKLDTQDAIHAVAGRFGRPVIRACHRWANHHVRYRVGSHVEWRRGNVCRGSLFAQHQELAQVKAIIDATSDETTREYQAEGFLTAANVKAKTFQFSVEDADEIRGSFDDAISESHAAVIPARYVALIRETRTVNYATDEEKRRNVLLALKPVR